MSDEYERGHAAGREAGIREAVAKCEAARLHRVTQLDTLDAKQDQRDRWIAGRIQCETLRDQILALLDSLPAPAGVTVQEAAEVWTGKVDKNGKRICAGDIVQYHNAKPATKPDYWNPVYQVEWSAPCFVLKHIGGGKDNDGMSFVLRHYSSDLEVLQPAALRALSEGRA